MMIDPHLFALLLNWRAQVQEYVDTAYLAATIYGEARSEPLQGQLCVAHVILGRAGDNSWQFGGPSIESVVLKRGTREDGRVGAEFTYWEKPSRARELRAVQFALALARNARNGIWRNPCDPSVRYYKNSSVAGPGGSCWFERNAVYVETEGNHDFYRPQRTMWEWFLGQQKKCYVESKPEPEKAHKHKKKPSKNKKSKKKAHKPARRHH